MPREQKISNGVKKKNITIDGLARMVQKGFLETAKKLEIDKRFDKVEVHSERIEKLLIAERRRRIEKLETDVRELEDLLAVK